MSNWYMPCPKCGASVNKSEGAEYKDDVRINSTWRTVLKKKVNYDCSNYKCDWTKEETKVIS